jgi:hypothetical protein
MPTKDEQIKTLTEKVQHLEEELKMCKLVIDKPVDTTQSGKSYTPPGPPNETASPKPQPAASNNPPSDTKPS